MADRNPQDQDKYILRFPKGMRELLKSRAAQRGRSLNSEIITRLEQTILEEDFEEAIEAAAQSEELTDDRIKEIYAPDQPAIVSHLAGAFARHLRSQSQNEGFQSRFELMDFIAGMMDDYGFSIENPRQPPFLLTHLEPELFKKVREAADATKFSTMARFVEGLIESSFRESSDVEKVVMTESIRRTQADLREKEAELTFQLDRYKALTGDDFPE